LYGDERRAVSEKKSEEEKNLKRIKCNKDENNSEAYYNAYRNKKTTNVKQNREKTITVDKRKNVKRKILKDEGLRVMKVNNRNVHQNVDKKKQKKKEESTGEKKD
jgi:hypothetical protein